VTRRVSSPSSSPSDPTHRSDAWRHTMDRSLPTTAHTPVTTFRDLMSISLVVVLAMFATATTARADVPLGTARTFAVLAGQSVTNSGQTISTTGGLFLPVVIVIALLILAGVLVASIRGRGRI
jgi:hypothetical protein